MQTRKSSPLPNPNDTLNKYRINYEVHYQNLHRYLIDRVQKQKHKRNLLMKEFTRLAKMLNRIEEYSQQITHNEMEIKQVKGKMSHVYTEICEIELEVHKLLQEDEGVILQLCEILNNKGKEIKSYRESDSKHSQVNFLHHVSNVLDIFHKDQQDATLSLDNKDFQSSGSSSNPLSKNSATLSLSNETRAHQSPQLTTQFQSKRENHLQQQANNRKNKLNEQNQLLIKCNQKVKNKSPNCNSEMKNQAKQNKIDKRCESHYYEGKQDVKKPQIPTEKIPSILNQYKKSDKLTDNTSTRSQPNNFIQLNSSTDDYPTQNSSINGQTVKSFRCNDNLKKNKLKNKKLLKSCITILD